MMLQAINLPKVLPTPERPHIGGPVEGGGGDYGPYFPPPGSGGSLPRDYNKPARAASAAGFLPNYSATVRPNYAYGPAFSDYDYHGYGPPSPSTDSPRRGTTVPRPKDHSEFNHTFDEVSVFGVSECGVMLKWPVFQVGAPVPPPAVEYGGATTPSERYGAYGYGPAPAATSPGYGHFEVGPQGYLDRRPSYDDRILYPPGEGGGGRESRWRDPDLHEVIEFLSHPNSVVQTNAAAYLQHLSYMDDNIKQKTRVLGGISPLIELLSQDSPEIQRNACGALRNLSFGRQNEENKVCLLLFLIPLCKDYTNFMKGHSQRRRHPGHCEASSQESGQRGAGAGHRGAVESLLLRGRLELSEGEAGLPTLACPQELKKPILEDALEVLVNHVILPHSGWDHSEQPQDIYWSTVFRNATGVLRIPPDGVWWWCRNISSAGEFARRRLRECEGLVDALLHLVRAAIGKNDIDNKSVENCVCTLRNLSYRCQEVEDPDYDKHISSSTSSTPFQSRAMLPIKVVGENLGCFGASRKKKEAGNSTAAANSTGSSSTSANAASTTAEGGKPRSGSAGGKPRGMELLWQPDVVQPYLSLLSECSNPETLEAAAGAVQNLAACYWPPSVEIRAAVRKEKGLPILVELLRMEVDRVVCAVATALRNLAMDQRNKELIGKYAMKDLVQKLPNGSPQHDAGTSDDTVAAVLATLNEVIIKNGDFARSLLEAGGVERLTYITKQKGKFSSRVVKFTSQLLFNMWQQHQELREVYRKAGWKESHFITRTLVARNSTVSPTASANNTLSRPISSQGPTHYEDRTLRPAAPNP
ncbi:PKP4, partial [Cordylochernes scorpioides]